MRDFPHLELRRSDLRNQANSLQRSIGYGSDQPGSNREEMYLDLLFGELRELDFVLGFFGRSYWAWWQWALLAVVGLLSLVAGVTALWTLIGG
ncbi:MAG TPA: hypothetical protein PL105_01045 [Caldilineaceae bacterium]|nr:hypothetical protein [Caldilineaceae bacterium]